MSKIHFITDYAKSNPITIFPSVLKKAPLLLPPLFPGKRARPAGCTVVCGNVPFQIPAERGTARLAHHSKDRRCWELETGRTEEEHGHQAQSFSLTLKEQMKIQPWAQPPSPFLHL